MIRVVLPHHLRTLAKVDKEVQLQVEGPVTVDAILTTLEAQYPMLRGTIRDQASLQRRDFIRFFGCGLDLSHDPTNTPLPDPIVSGTEPLRIIGAMAGG
jgi:sulfur-carrier protein